MTLFQFSKPKKKEDKPVVVTTPPPCRHLKSEVRPNNTVGWAFCPKCYKEVPLWEVFNNMLSEFQAQMKELKKLREKLEAA